MFGELPVVQPGWREEGSVVGGGLAGTEHAGEGAGTVPEGRGGLSSRRSVLRLPRKGG